MRIFDLAVKDTGIGMKKDQYKKYLMNLVKLAMTQPRSLGYWVGLTITKTLVEMMGGSVDVARKGAGSVFTLRIPRDFEKFSYTKKDEDERTLKL